jgi:alkylation response protein AidB-like acyl-CoA dehydrogenase
VPLTLNEEQRLLKETAQEFFNNNAPISELRKLRDNSDKQGYSEALWQSMVDLGWSGITIAEAYDGLEFGALGLGAIIEESGKTLTASPLLATVTLAANIIELAGNDIQKRQLLPAIIRGEMTLAVALDESAHHAPNTINLQAVRDGDDYVLSGKKYFVIDGHSADHLIVAARTSGETSEKNGISLFLLPSNSIGLSCNRTILADSRNAATIAFNSVRIPASALVGELDNGWESLAVALDRARVYLTAEMLGGATECFDRTISYLNEREQFGVKIGSFQALKHRAAILYVNLELAKSAVLDALSAIDDEGADLAKAASLAKTLMNDSYEAITNEAVQMHGGIGVTDDLDIGLFLKRSRVATQLFGDSGFHKKRYASILGV